MLLVPLHPHSHTHTHFKLCVVWLDDSLVEIIFPIRDWAAKEEVEEEQENQCTNAGLWNTLIAVV